MLRGQKIAEAGGFVSAPIYSSVSGKVKAIQPRRGAVGDMVNSIIIENDGEMKEVEFTLVEDVTALSNYCEGQRSRCCGNGRSWFSDSCKIVT